MSTVPVFISKIFLHAIRRTWFLVKCSGKTQPPSHSMFTFHRYLVLNCIPYSILLYREFHKYPPPHLTNYAITFNHLRYLKRALAHVVEVVLSTFWLYRRFLLQPLSKGCWIEVEKMFMYPYCVISTRHTKLWTLYMVAEL